MEQNALLDLRNEPEIFPVLATWEPEELTQRLTQVLMNDKQPVNIQNLRRYAALLESDLQGMFTETSALD